MTNILPGHESILSRFTVNDLEVLRKVVKKVHHIHFPELKMENEQADMMIEALAEDTIYKYLEYGKHLQQKRYAPK